MKFRSPLTPLPGRGVGGGHGAVRAAGDLQYRPEQPVHLVAVHGPAAAGRGAHLDERLWRSLKYECVYLHAFETGSELRAGPSQWIGYYDAGRPHSSLNGRTPDEAYSRHQMVRLAA